MTNICLLWQPQAKKFGNLEKEMNEIWRSSKIRQDKKNLVSTFACFLTAVAKVLSWERKLSTKLCLHRNLRFF